MKTFRERVMQKWAVVRVGLVRFAPCHICSVFMAAIASISLHGRLSPNAYEHLLAGAFWGLLVGLFVRLLVERRGWTRCWRVLLPWVATGTAGVLGTIFWHGIGIESRYYLPWVMIYWSVCAALASLAVALLYSRQNERQLFAELVLNALCVSASCLVLVLGGIVCVGAFDKLIVSISEDCYVDVCIVGWMVLFPIGFLSLLPHRDEVAARADRASAFLAWLLLPPAFVLLAILYAYLVKIVVMGSLPSGMLNWFGSIALGIYLFFWLTLRGAKRPFFAFVIRWGWAALIPVLVAQGIGIVIRYRAYGLSTPRMAGMVLLGVGIYALARAALNRSPKRVFVVFALTGLAFTITPFNIIDIPIRDQEARLRAVLARNGCFWEGAFVIPEKVEMDERDAKIVVSTWDYLVSKRYGHFFCTWRNAEIGAMKPGIWYRSEFLRELCEVLERMAQEGRIAKCDLIGALGVNKDVQNDGHGEHGARRYCGVLFKLPKNADISLDGYARARPLANELIKIARTGDAYSIQLTPNGEVFDVTADVVRLLGKVENGRLLEKDGEFVIEPQHAIWRLSPDLSLAVFDICASGMRGSDMADRLLIRKGLLLFHAK